MSDSLKDRYASSPLFGSNAALVEMLYERYLEQPASVDPAWADYFRTLSNGVNHDVAHGPIRDALVERGRRAPVAATSAASDAELEKQTAVLRLITNYRLHGYLEANLDPLGMTLPPSAPDLTPGFHGLTDADLNTEFLTADLAGSDRMKLSDIFSMLKVIYGGSIGAEFSHITSTAERLWLRERFEYGQVGEPMGAERQEALLRQLTAAEGIERYLHTRYVGQKRFGLEGGESMIPLIDEIIQSAGEKGTQECVIGMAHRGRLNVLVNVLGKSPSMLFSEFEGTSRISTAEGSGDVKYHLGFSADLRTPGGNMHVALAFNPSHLEIVNPVVTGSVRARQERRGDKQRNTVLPLLIHGDAAFAGQGVVMETFQLSETRGFATGGTVHIICNNQVGFTTSNPRDARSTPFCSDVAKMIEAPILHVNADDPEAVIAVARLALDYRMRFNKDVVIDLVCYRRHGHNEADEPAATQPQMYQTIRKRDSIRSLYAKQLVDGGVIDAARPRQMAENYRERLDAGQPVPEALVGTTGDEYTVDWSLYQEGSLQLGVETRITSEDASRLGAAMLDVPADVKLHNRVSKIMQSRQEMLDGKREMDWGFAENLAYASILNDGYPIRLTGQDAGRGTFFHRHAVLHDQNEKGCHIPLQHLFDDQPQFEVIDSLLSEEAVLGFEYGFATTEPRSLVIWEAQFGDFANGAQVVIDQFITSGETKWGRLCGLVMLLPHGYEGQGPEHSSARLERFLQMCAEGNIQVCVPSTPAQMFHLLRRQMIRPLRKPLIVMTPKSLLRHKEAVSARGLIEGGGFQLVIADREIPDDAAVKRIVFCSGKVYYDLKDERRNAEINDVAIVRIEQLYPFPSDYYGAEIARYANAREIVWCQEEPQNQGAWYQIRHQLQAGLTDEHELFYAGRAGSAAPASGYFSVHVEQQKGLVAAALGITKR
ncbi:MAG: 2-oxoglutarate dehydrogenase E1 component [Gammaproteobacteria bacterium]